MTTATERLLTYALGRGLEYYDQPVRPPDCPRGRGERHPLVGNRSGDCGEPAVSDAAGARVGVSERSHNTWVQEGVANHDRHQEVSLSPNGAACLGATVALPLLDGMVPALAAAMRTTGAAPARRLGAIYVPNGVEMRAWTPTTEGTGFAFTPILKPLEPFRDQVCVLSGLADKPAVPLPGEGSATTRARPRRG